LNAAAVGPFAVSASSPAASVLNADSFGPFAVFASSWSLSLLLCSTSVLDKRIA
jgi:hypothetical protein